MSSRRLWRPESSYTAANVGSEEGGRGSLYASSSEQEHEVEGSGKTAPGRNKIHLPRRRTPTVYVPPENKAPKTFSSGEHSYKSIEKREEVSLHEQSSLPFQKQKVPNPKTHNWFCGWIEHECFDLYQADKMLPVETDRMKIQTPAEGNRSTLQSRASNSRYNSSYGSRKKHDYTFHHLEDIDSYIEDYRDLYSFTTLSSPRYDEKIFCEGEDVEQYSEVILPLGVKSLYRGDPYLKELMNRLGIKEVPPTTEASSPQESRERHPQLLMSPRPTPPSIVKKRGKAHDEVDIVVSNSGSKW